MGYIYGFTDANGDGFPDGLTFPEASGGNFDIEVVDRNRPMCLNNFSQRLAAVPPGSFGINLQGENMSTELKAAVIGCNGIGIRHLQSRKAGTDHEPRDK